MAPVIAPQAVPRQDALVTISAATWRPQPIALLARPIAAAAVAGFTMGALIGGLGGRLAMLVLRLTSDPSLHGVETDDGFTIGVISSQTTFLIVITAVFGAVGGLVYVVVRTWLPSGRRAPAYGALSGVVGGSLVIHPDGLDFTVLDPLWLAIVMFIAIPAGYGFAVAALVERWLRTTSTAFSRAWQVGLVLVGLILVLLPIALRGGQGLIVVLVIVLAIAVVRRSPAAVYFLGSPPVVWLGRIGLLGIGVYAGVSLVSDVIDIL
jgi:hypothetical protein